MHGWPGRALRFGGSPLFFTSFLWRRTLSAGPGASLCFSCDFLKGERRLGPQRHATMGVAARARLPTIGREKLQRQKKKSLLITNRIWCGHQATRGVTHELNRQGTCHLSQRKRRQSSRDGSTSTQHLIESPSHEPVHQTPSETPRIKGVATTAPT